MTRQFRLIGGMLCAFAGLLAPAPASADHRHAQLSYAIYSGGFQIFTLDASATLGPNGYSAEMLGRTNGLFEWVLRFVLGARSEGGVKASGLVPVRYQTDSEWRWNKRTMTIDWDDARMPTARRVPLADPYSEDRTPVTPVMMVGTTDLLTALLDRVLAKPGRDPCQGTTPIYDGRRRYDLRFTPQGREKLEPSRYSIFAGESMKCRIDLIRIAGYKIVTDEGDMSAEDDTTMVWLGRMQANEPLVPVRIEAANRIGRIIGHVTRARLETDTHAIGHLPSPADPAFAAEAAASAEKAAGFAKAGADPVK
jgi:Protein of unknown function (DUF3108)